MKKLAKIAVLISFIILSGCNSAKELKIPKGGVANMKIKTLEELLASRELVLPERQTKDRDHTWYLDDRTKVEFHRCINKSSTSSYANISSDKYPFLMFQKGYFCKTGRSRGISKSIRGISLEETKIYNENGELIKKINYGERLGYKKILKWAEERGYLDFKSVKVLEGRDFDMSYDEKIPQYYDTYYKKYLREYKDEKVVKKLLEHKVLWTYTTLYMKEYRSFVFSEKGELLYDAGKKPIITYASGEEAE